MKEEMARCPLCGRLCLESLLERHHLRTRKRGAKEIERICRECHKTVHGLFKNTELRDPKLGLDTLEGLLSHESFQKAVPFIRKLTPGGFMRMRQSSRAKKRR